MQCKSLWIKASAKCINVNVNVNNTHLTVYAVSTEPTTKSPTQVAIRAQSLSNDSTAEEPYAGFNAQIQGSRFFIIRHIHNHTSIISSEMQVELKKNTAFT